MAAANLMQDVAEDLGGRLAARRRQLGLTADEVERRAGLDSGYVTYLEEQAATPSPNALEALATALETPVEDLIGVGPHAPDGAGAAAPDPTLERLDHRSSQALIEGGGVGRIAMTRQYAPIVMPVNFILDDGDIVIRTTAHSQVAAAARTQDRVSFEVDHLDERTSEGWSVVATGRLRVVTGPEVDALKVRLSAWAGDAERGVVVRLVPGTLTGRRIRTA